MNKKLVFSITLTLIIYIIIGLIFILDSRIPKDYKYNNYNEEISKLNNYQFITVLDGEQKCEINKDIHNNISCKFFVNSSEDYKFYQDFITLELKPELENMIDIIYNNGSDIFKGINDWSFTEYSIYYNDILLVEYKPNWGNDILFTEDIFKPFLDHFTSIEALEFIPRNNISIFCPTIYNNSIFSEVDIHLYFTNFLDDKGNKGNAGLLGLQDKTLSTIYFNVKNNQVGNNGDLCYTIYHDNKIISYDMVIYEINSQGKTYTFKHEFSYDDK